METILSLVVAVAAVQLVSASVIRDEQVILPEVPQVPFSLETPPEVPQVPFSLETPPEVPQVPFSLQTPPVIPQAPEPLKNKVFLKAEEHTDEDVEEHDPQVDGFNPNDELAVSYILTPEQKLNELARLEAEAEAQAQLQAQQAQQQAQ